MPLNPVLRRKIKNALHKLTIITQFNKNITLKYQGEHPVTFADGDTRGLMKLLNETLERSVNTKLYTKERRINAHEKRKSRIPWYILQEETAIKLLWDTYILMLLLYLAWTIPMSMAFGTTEDLTTTILEFWVDSFFILDLLVNFFVTFEVRGVVQNSLVVIAKQYLMSGFLFDFICSFPLNWILMGVNLGSATQIILVKQLLRLVRVLKVGPKLVMVFNYLKLDPPTVRLILSLVSLIFVLHYVACGYWWMSVREYGGITTCPEGTQCWVNLCVCSPYDSIPQNSTWYSSANPNQWLPNAYIFQTTDPYLVSFYWAITAITSVGINIIPQTRIEYIYTIIIIILGVLFYALLISNISNVMNSRDVVQAEHVAFLDKVQTFMRKNKVPNYFYTTICDFYRNQWKNEDPQSNDDLFQALPLTLKRNLRQILWRDLANDYKILQLLDVNSYYYLVSHLVKKTYLPGETITKKNETADTMFFVSRGKVDAVSLDDITVYYTTYPGEFFGEACFLTQGIVKRECTFRAVQYVDVYVLTRNVFNTVCLSSPEFVGALVFESNRRKKLTRRESILVNTNLTNTSGAVRIKERANSKIFQLYGSQIRLAQVAPSGASMVIPVDEEEEPDTVKAAEPFPLTPPLVTSPRVPRHLNIGSQDLKPLSFYSKEGAE